MNTTPLGETMAETFTPLECGQCGTQYLTGGLDTFAVCRRCGHEMARSDFTLDEGETLTIRDGVVGYTTTDADAEHRRNMARLMGGVADALGEMLAYWTENDLPGDFLYNAETGNTVYPFGRSLDDLTSEVRHAAQRLADGAL